MIDEWQLQWSSVCLKWLGETTKASIMTSGLRSNSWTRDVPNTSSTNQTATISAKHVKRRKAHLGIACTPKCQSRVYDVHRTHRRATSGMFCNLSFWNRDRPVWEQPDLLDSPALCSIISNCYVTVAITPERNFRRWFSLHVYILSCSPKHYVIAASWTPVVTTPPNNGLQ